MILSLSHCHTHTHTHTQAYILTHSLERDVSPPSPREFTRNVALPKNRQGQILVDSHLRVLGDTSGRVFALGDCAQVEGHTLPCTGWLVKHGHYLELYTRCIEV